MEFVLGKKYWRPPVNLMAGSKVHEYRGVTSKGLAIFESPNGSVNTFDPEAMLRQGWVEYKEPPKPITCRQTLVWFKHDSGSVYAYTGFDTCMLTKDHVGFYHDNYGVVLKVDELRFDYQPKET